MLFITFIFALLNIELQVDDDRPLEQVLLQTRHDGWRADQVPAEVEDFFWKERPNRNDLRSLLLNSASQKSDVSCFLQTNFEEVFL